MSVEKDNVDVYGTHYIRPNFSDKFKIIDSIYLFKKGTIKNSCYKDELYLVNDNLGVYKSWVGNYVVAQLTPYYNQEDYWDNQKQDYCVRRYIEYYDCNDVVKIDEYYNKHKEECDKWFVENIDKKVYEDKLEELKLERKENYNQYYEFELGDQKYADCRIYLENKRFNHTDSIEINCNNHGLVVNIGGLVLGSNGNYSSSEKVFITLLKYICKNKGLFDDIKELDNGWVFNNQYYEKLDHVYEDIYEVIKEKKLLNKFMSEGLNLNDLQEREE